MPDIDINNLRSLIATDIMDAYRISSIGNCKDTTQLKDNFQRILSMKLSKNDSISQEINTLSNKALLTLQQPEFVLETTDSIPDKFNPEYINTFSTGVNVSGTIAGSMEFNLVIEQNPLNKLSPYVQSHENQWHGKNGKWYPLEQKFHGNQYTGSKAKIISKAKNLNTFGNACFVAGTFISFYQFSEARENNDSLGQAKAVADVTIGFISTFGGPVGWFIGGVYLFLNLTGFFEYSRPINPSTHIDPTKCPRDKTYVAPKYIIFDKML